MCGTDAGYARHLTACERPCDECRVAHNAARRERYHNPKGRRKSNGRHGTYGGWHQHRKAGEKPCEACRQARNRYQREWHALQADRYTVRSVILDVLETVGSSMSWRSLTAWVTELHPEWTSETVKRTLYRLVSEQKVERVEFGEEIRYRMP